MVNLSSLSSGLFAVALYVPLSAFAVPLPNIQYTVQSTNGLNSDTFVRRSSHLERRAPCPPATFASAFGQEGKIPPAVATAFGKNGKIPQSTIFMSLNPSLEVGGCTYYKEYPDAKGKSRFWVIQEVPDGMKVPDTWKKSLGQVSQSRDTGLNRDGFKGTVLDIVAPETVTNLEGLKTLLKTLPPLKPVEDDATSAEKATTEQPSRASEAKPPRSRSGSPPRHPEAIQDAPAEPATPVKKALNRLSAGIERAKSAYNAMFDKTGAEEVKSGNEGESRARTVSFGASVEMPHEIIK